MFFSKPTTSLDYFFRDIVLAVLYLLCITVIPMVSTVLAMKIAGDAAKDYAISIIAWPILIGIACVYFFFHRRKQTSEEKEFKRKLKERLDAGEALVTETTAPLTEEDIGKIKKLKFWFTLLLILAMGIVLFVVYQAAKVFSDYPLYLYITVGIGVLFALLIYKYIQIFGKIITKGEKTVVRGIVTRKYSQGGRTSTNYIDVGKLPFSQINRYTYLPIRVGDEVELEVLKNFGNWVLKQTTISKV